MRIDVDKALDTLLAHVGPTITTHPFTLAQWAFELPKTTLFTLIRGQTFSFWTSLDNINISELIKSPTTAT